MKILFVDDNLLLGSMITKIIESERPDWEFIHISDSVEALDHLQQNAYDMAVLDILMPNMDGYELLKNIRNNNDFNKIQIILATCLDNRNSMRLGMELGADDFLTKPYTGSELIAAIEARRKRTAVRDNGTFDIANRLTPRELEVLRLIAKGFVGKEIAQQLNISVNTVSIHKTNIMKKTGLHTSSGLAAYAAKVGLI